MGFSVVSLNKELSWKRKCSIIFPGENLQHALKGQGLWVAVIPSGSLEPMPSSLPYFHFEWCFLRLQEGAALCYVSVDDFEVEDKAFGSCLGIKVSLKSVVVALM